MNKEFYKQLVDMYAADELPAELANELEAKAKDDQDLNHDMTTLRQTVELLQNDNEAALTEESYYRILAKMHSKGVDVEPHAPEPKYIQYHLPITG